MSIELLGIRIMERECSFEGVIDFLKNNHDVTPGYMDYNAAFCQLLKTAASAEEASIWKADSDGNLHLIYGSNVLAEQVEDIILKKGEGISGAAVLSKKAISVSDALHYLEHDHRIDKRIHFQTQSMISAPIIFDDEVFGVINILNYSFGESFPLEWEEKLSLIGERYAAALSLAGRLSYYHPFSIKNQTKALRSPKSSSKSDVIGVTPIFQEAYQQCKQAANTDIPVSIIGEIGTGKELAARLIHEESNRSNGPFVSVNCSTLSEPDLEIELFGHSRIHFRKARRPGSFVYASGGTLLLKRIEDISTACQNKILHAIREKSIFQVDSDEKISCDVRILATSFHELEALFAQHKILPEFYSMLSRFKVTLPPLRVRVEEIPYLVTHFINKESKQRRKHEFSYQTPQISESTIAILKSYEWPGNIRELKMAVETAIALCNGSGEIQPEHLPERIFRPSCLSPGNSYSELIYSPDIDLSMQKERLRYIKALEQTKFPGTGRWNVKKASELLGIPRGTLRNRIHKLTIHQQ